MPDQEGGGRRWAWLIATALVGCAGAGPNCPEATLQEWFASHPKLQPVARPGERFIYSNVNLMLALRATEIYLGLPRD